MRETVLALSMGGMMHYYQTNAPRSIVSQMRMYDTSANEFLDSIRKEGYVVERLQADYFLTFDK